MLAKDKKIITIAGPTCTGKSDLALAVAKRFDGEIINADAMQVYRYFDIGTAKPTGDMIRAVPHHLIDVVEPHESFNGSLFLKLADDAIRNIWSRRRVPVIVGGTGLYMRILLYGLSEAKGDEDVRNRLQEEYRLDPLGTYESLKRVDSQYALRISHRDRIRVVRALEVFEVTGKTMTAWQQIHGFRKQRYNAWRIGLNRKRNALYSLINKRVDMMLSMGWVEEVKDLMNRNVGNDVRPFTGIGYREILLYIQGGISYEDMVQEVKKKTRQYAKRQLTWFLRENDICWYEFPEEEARIHDDIKGFLEWSD